MDSNVPSAPAMSHEVPPVLRRRGRPSGYSEETVGRLCEMIRRRGMSDGAAGLSLGISRPTMTHWKQEHPELREWLALAREQYRHTRLASFHEMLPPERGRDWRVAARELARVFPKDYGRGRRVNLTALEDTAA